MIILYVALVMSIIMLAWIRSEIEWARAYPEDNSKHSFEWARKLSRWLEKKSRK